LGFTLRQKKFAKNFSCDEQTEAHVNQTTENPSVIFTQAKKNAKENPKSGKIHQARLLKI